MEIELGSCELYPKYPNFLWMYQTKALSLQKNIMTIWKKILKKIKKNAESPPVAGSTLPLRFCNILKKIFGLLHNSWP